MKKVLLLGIACGFLAIVQGQSMLDNFDDIRLTNYGFVNGEYFEYVPNPDNTGINGSPNCAEYIRNPVEQFDVLIVETDSLTDVSDYISGTKAMQMDVYSPAPGITVQITMEDSVAAEPFNYPIGRHSEYTAVTTTSGEWETLTFALVNEPDPAVPNTAVNRLVILFNPGSFTADTYYWDNFITPEQVNNPCDGVTPDPLVLDDFECNHNFFIEYSDGRMNKVLNPDMAGNDSENALRYIRNGGAEDDVIIGVFDNPLDLTTNNQLKMLVYDMDAPSNIVVSFQDASNNELLAVLDSTENSETWEELSFDFSDIASSTNAEKFVILYEPGQFADDIVYMDNIRLEAMPTGIASVSNSLKEVRLFPNPTSGTLRIAFDLADVRELTLSVYNTLGRQLSELAYGTLPAGSHNLSWDASGLSAGNYFLVLRSGEQIMHTEMLNIIE